MAFPDDSPPTPPVRPLTDGDPPSPGLNGPLQRPGSKDGSLSTNYFPTKFSTGLLSPTPRRRKGRAGLVQPKRGGGREAFKNDESRMPVDGDEDYDGIDGGLFTKDGGHTRPRMRWNIFKWSLFIANILLTAWSLTGIIFCLFVWFDVFDHSDIIRVGNHTELVFSTLAASIAAFTCVIGWAGVLLNNRSFLAVYTFMLWVCFAFLVTPGYMTYKTRTFNLEGKVNDQWSRHLGALGRLRIQDRLHCCGYFSPFVEATVSQTCYSRTVLPGCKAAYLAFQRYTLKMWYTVAFSLVPCQIFIMVTALLCSNHVTYRFGKGMMPKAYRLSMASTAVLMDNVASQLASQYGASINSDWMAALKDNMSEKTPASSNRGSIIMRRPPPVQF